MKKFLIIIAVLAVGALAPTFAQTNCQTDTSSNNLYSRATGLISAPSLSGIFSNPTGQCIVDPKAGFAPFKIPGYDDLKSLYYDQKSSSGLSTPPPPSTNGLLAYWKFDQGSGSIVQDSTGTNNGSASNMTWVKGVSGKSGDYAGLFDNSSVTVPNTVSVKGLSSFTISAWVNPSFVATTQFSDLRILYWESISSDMLTSRAALMLVKNAANISNTTSKFAFQVRTGDSVLGSAVSTTTPNINQWYQIVGVFDNGTAYIYVNGQLEGSVAGLGSSIASTNPYELPNIGRISPYYAYYYYLGAIDEVRVHQRALSASEIQTLYNYTLPPTQAVTKYPPASCKSSDVCQDESYFNLGGAGEILSDAIYYIPGKLVLGQTNPLTSKNNTIVVFVNGDLTIKKDLIYGGNLSGLVLVVKGNVNIDPTVTRIDAVLISEGQFCSVRQSTGGCKETIGGDQQLVINGSIISLNQDKPPVFTRNLADNSQPAELINHQVKYLVILRNLMSDTFQRWSEIP